MDANDEYLYILQLLQDKMLPDLDFTNHEIEKDILNRLLEEAAFIGFFSEIGICKESNLTAISLRLQKQATSNISLQLGSCINTNFNTLKTQYLTDNHYKFLVKPDEMDREMQTCGEAIPDSKGRIDETFWKYAIEYEKQTEQFLCFSTEAKPFVYTKRKKEKNLQQIKKDQTERTHINTDKDGADGEDRERNKWPFISSCQCIQKFTKRLDRY
uniref:Wsv133-like protein n=1 Tax=Trachysalambria curvirostris majanivirus TaxID=2984281 RepID=A0A9C7BMS4_9VIRU|nr:MAG: wsv133-like protein [Trachysalambria curvirostris majanivirus]